MSTRELRDISAALFDHLDRTGQAGVELPWDFYWDMSSDELYQPYAAPTDLSLGQLSEDWTKLKAIVSGDMPAVGPAVAWLAAVLRAVGDASTA